MNIADYKGVWVFAEQRDGELQKVSLELLGKGREIANKVGTELTAILLGHQTDHIAKELIAYGADRVIAADHPLLGHFSTDAYTKVMCDIIKDKKPEILIIGATYLGRDLGPRIAARLATGLTADCTALDVDSENNNNLLMTRPAFGGNLMATIVCGENRPQMATVRPGVFEKTARDDVKQGHIEAFPVVLSENDIRTKSIDVVKLEKDIPDVTEANFIVSGGRGVGGKENFVLLGELAQNLGGVVGGSRAAVESGWVDKAVQVGQTGKTVRPNVYIACGISGAIQHLAGMQESDFIIAINKDSGAPIMQVADVAIVGDFMKVLPEMINEISNLKNQ